MCSYLLFGIFRVDFCRFYCNNKILTLCKLFLYLASVAIETTKLKISKITLQ